MKNFSEKEFLIIDDEEVLREILMDEFDLLGAKCTGAENGEEGLKLAKEKIYDVIISDIRMPVLDGVEFLERLKKEAPNHCPRVVLLSGFTDLTQDQAIQMGAVGLVEKPWDMDKLIKLIDHALQSK